MRHERYDTYPDVLPEVTGPRSLVQQLQQQQSKQEWPNVPIAKTSHTWAGYIRCLSPLDVRRQLSSCIAPTASSTAPASASASASADGAGQVRRVLPKARCRLFAACWLTPPGPQQASFARWRINPLVCFVNPWQNPASDQQSDGRRVEMAIVPCSVHCVDCHC
ncbi:hypothetical protein LZ30DRAFT_686655 [Colletotrichum cereale]|nr:hypothetical protein LZ30DRAFT_686655 [Colletotrichum cereale]